MQARWVEHPECIQTFDKAAHSTVHFAYSFDGPDDIPPINSIDEVPDSRRHQFFAMCQHRHRQTLVPRWISRADVDRALAFGFPMLDPGPLGILESHPHWASCAIRINTDQARVPITHAQAAQGVAWDITQAPSASYVIDAYTWEPPENLWSSPSRPGAVRIWDSRVDTSPPPAAAFDASPSIGFRGDTQTLRGCLAADPGALVTWSFAALPGAGLEPQWVPMGPPSRVVSGAFTLPFVPPPLDSAAGATKWIVKADVVDPSGRSYTAHTRADILVLDQPSDSEFEYVPPPRENSDGGACASVTGQRSQGGLWWMLGLLGLWRRPRRPGRVAPSAHRSLRA